MSDSDNKDKLSYLVCQEKNIVMIGGLWYALSMIGLGMTYCVGKAMLDTMHGHGYGHGGHDAHH